MVRISGNRVVDIDGFFIRLFVNSVGSMPSHAVSLGCKFSAESISGIEDWKIISLIACGFIAGGLVPCTHGTSQFNILPSKQKE
jgi:hypothetical protein